ncbi:MAG: LamG-like jellyroll fold domain-containing protein, partial [Acidobacteriota bacterium]
MKASDANQSPALVTRQEVSYTTTLVPHRILTKQYLTSANALTPKETYTYLDGLGRVIQTRGATETPNQYSVRTITYDELGRVSKEYVPIFQTGVGYQATSQPQSQYTSYAYDALNRPTTITAPTGTTTYAYQNWSATTTDANNHKKRHTSDAYGRLTTVDEYTNANANTYVTTTYAYDTVGNLTKITDAEGNARNFTYDSLNRQLTNELAHKPSQQASIYYYVYDANGNRTQESDPNGKIANYTYDSLNRLTMKDDPATATIAETVYTYDTAANGKGKVTSITTPDKKEEYQYTKQGQVSSKKETVGQGSNPATPPTTNLKAHVPFNEGAGNSATDASGNGNNGTFQGGATWGAGVSGTGANFDGVDDYVNLGAPTFINNTQGTVSLWVKLDNTSQVSVLWSATSLASTDDEFYFSYRGDINREIMIYVLQNGTYTMHLTTGANIITDTNWHNLVLTSNGATVKFYLDGVEKALSAGLGANNGQWFDDATDAGQFTIGTLLRGSAIVPVDGVVDELRVYDRPLTDTEVAAIYLSETASGGQTVNTTSYIYDTYGALQGVTHPNASVVAYTYNVLGKLETETRNGQPNVTGVEYGETEAITKVAYANGAVETYTYDPNKLYRLTGKTTHQGVAATIVPAAHLKLD